ncbi:MAG: hypothetical protein EOP85_13280, partial [Verrucomicrobiaceae bacterium]
MLDSDENSGVFTFLAGMIVLVLVAVGFSLLVDKRFKFSTGIGELRKEIEADAAELGELTSRHERLTRELTDLSSTRVKAADEHAEITRDLKELARSIQLLGDQKAEMESSVAAIESDFSNYRADYRGKIWARAVGESLGDLTLPGGRAYKSSTITKVTDVGLEIRHEHGIARIQAPDLSQSLQERFQWNDEERRVRLKEEARFHRKFGEAAAEKDGAKGNALATGSLQQVNAEKSAEDRAARREKLVSLRQQVKGWKTRVKKLASEKSDA